MVPAFTKFVHVRGPIATTNVVQDAAHLPAVRQQDTWMDGLSSGFPAAALPTILHAWWGFPYRCLEHEHARIFLLNDPASADNTLGQISRIHMPQRTNVPRSCSLRWGTICTAFWANSLLSCMPTLFTVVTNKSSSRTLSVRPLHWPCDAPQIQVDCGRIRVQSDECTNAGMRGINPRQGKQCALTAHGSTWTMHAS